MQDTTPSLSTVFISYSFDSPEHKRWVLGLANRLRSDHVKVLFDQWDLKPGDLITHYMERAISDSDKVLFVCTPRYRIRSDDRTGGVGYEGNIISSEIFATTNHRKFVPLLRNGTWAEAAPAWAKGKLYIDFSDDAGFDEPYTVLLDSIRESLPTAPAPTNLPEPVSPAVATVTIEVAPLRNAVHHWEHSLALDDRNFGSVSNGCVLQVDSSPGEHKLKLAFTCDVLRGRNVWRKEPSHRIFDIRLAAGSNRLKLDLIPGQANFFSKKFDAYLLDLNGTHQRIDW